MKKHLLLPIFSIFLSCFSTRINANQALPQSAQTWVNTYIFQKDGTPRISEYDIQVITNLIYLSWLRSALTIKAQQEIVTILDILWKGWQNVAQTRLDPSIDLPYSISPEQQETTNNFWRLATYHRSIGTIYTYAVKMILEKQIIQSSLALDGVAEMRNKARKVVLGSLTDIRKQLGQFFGSKTYNVTENELLEQTIINIEKNLDTPKKGINLFDYISSYIPQLALHSFVEANNIQNIVSEEGWQVLKTIQEIGNQTWKAIEEARADFYRAYYKALVEAIKKYSLPTTCLLLMFDEQGIIKADNQIQLLPDPSKLELDISPVC